MPSKAIRRKFASGLLVGLDLVWPVLSVLVVLIVGLGVLVGLIEGWSLQESVYFAFVTGLTIGYGDFSPTLLLTRTLAVMIGVCGVLVTALVAGVAVQAFAAAREEKGP